MPGGFWDTDDDDDDYTGDSSRSRSENESPPSSTSPQQMSASSYILNGLEPINSLFDESFVEEVPWKSKRERTAAMATSADRATAAPMATFTPWTMPAATVPAVPAARAARARATRTKRKWVPVSKPGGAATQGAESDAMLDRTRIAAGQQSTLAFPQAQWAAVSGDKGADRRAEILCSSVNQPHVQSYVQPIDRPNRQPHGQYKRAVQGQGLSHHMQGPVVQQRLHTPTPVPGTSTASTLPSSSGRGGARAPSIEIKADLISFSEAVVYLTQIGCTKGTRFDSFGPEKRQLEARPPLFTREILAGPWPILYYERPKQRRRHGQDKYTSSGGKRGSRTQYNDATNLGLRRKYGTVLPVGISASGLGEVCVRYCAYSIFHKRDGVHVEDDSAVLFHVYIDQQPSRKKKGVETVKAAKAARSLTKIPIEHMKVRGTGGSSEVVSKLTIDVSQVKDNGDVKFMDFIGKNGTSIGSICQDYQNPGITIEGKSGDFAEWHQRAHGEPLFEEGDVVGFTDGQLTRSTARAQMAGIVSKRALLKGSRPATKDLPQYDTVAYCGQVPVKMLISNKRRDRGSAGDLVQTSGRGDGVAVVAKEQSFYARLWGPKVFTVGVIAEQRATKEAIFGDVECIPLKCSEDPQHNSKTALLGEPQTQLVMVQVINPTLSTRYGDRVGDLLKALSTLIALGAFLLLGYTVLIFCQDRNTAALAKSTLWNEQWPLFIRQNWSNATVPVGVCPMFDTRRCASFACQCAEGLEQIVVLGVDNSSNMPRPCFSCKKRPMLEMCTRGDASSFFVRVATDGAATSCVSARVDGLCSQPVVRDMCCASCPPARSKRTTRRTVNGCVCLEHWSIGGGEPNAPCSAASPYPWVYSGCGMQTPCDGRDGGVRGNSWCVVDPAISCENDLGHERNFDWCQPRGLETVDGNGHSFHIM